MGWSASQHGPLLLLQMREILGGRWRRDVPRHAPEPEPLEATAEPVDRIKTAESMAAVVFDEGLSRPQQQKENKQVEKKAA
jgi:hypothetical protein